MKVTAVVSEQTTPLPPASPWPLLYAVEVEDPKDKAQILTQVAMIRHEEIVGSKIDPQLLLEIYQGLELHFVFAGDVGTLADWRE